MGQFLKRLFSPLHIVSRAHLPEAASTLRAGLALGNVPERRARLPHASRPLPRLCTLGILGDRCSSRPSQLPSPGLALMSRLLAAADRPSSSPVTPSRATTRNRTRRPPSVLSVVRRRRLSYPPSSPSLRLADRRPRREEAGLGVVARALQLRLSRYCTTSATQAVHLAVHL